MLVKYFVLETLPRCICGNCGFDYFSNLRSLIYEKKNNFY